MNYTLYFTYPDGHVEEIEERFATLEEAKDYAKKLMIQVENTERFHQAGSFRSTKKHSKASFVIEKKGEGSSEIAFDSRTNR